MVKKPYTNGDKQEHVTYHLLRRVNTKEFWFKILYDVSSQFFHVTFLYNKNNDYLVDSSE